MCTPISELLQEIVKVKTLSSCAKCASIEKLRQLSNCGHLICQTCFNSAASECPVCRVAFRRRDSLPDDNLQAILTNIYSLSNVSKLQEEGRLDFGNPQIRVFFAPETTINKRDHKGETRLHKDCRDGSYNKVDALLQTGVDPNVQDFAAWTALHEAVTANKIEVVKLLLDYGALVSIPGLNYTTPLHAAVQENNDTMAKLLVEYGADLMCFNIDGKTPFDLCTSQEMKNVLCLTPRRSDMYKVYTIPQPKVFFINVDSEDAQKLAGLPNIQISTEQNLLNGCDTTYVIVGDSNPNIKHLQAAMLQGTCIVNTKWIDEFVTKKSVSPLAYIPHIPGLAINEAVMNTFNKLPKLFDGLRFFFCHTNAQKIGGCKYTVEDFKTLVRLGGGRIVARRPTGIQEHDVYYPYHAGKDTNLATTTYYLIYDETLLSAIETRTTGIKYKSSRWLVECINNFCMVT